MRRSTFISLLSALGFHGSSTLDEDDDIPEGQKLLPGNYVLMWGTADESGDAIFPASVAKVERIVAADDQGRPQPVFETFNWNATMDPGMHWMLVGSFGVPAGQA